MSGPARVVWWALLHPVRTAKLAAACALILVVAAAWYDGQPHPARSGYHTTTTTIRGGRR